MSRRIRRRLRRLLHSSLIREDLESDPNYDVGGVSEGFSDRPGDIGDSTIFARIIRAYNKAKLAQQQAPAVYQVSNEWLPIYARHMGDVMSALKDGDVTSLRRIYNNFMREPCSTGLHGLPVDMRKHFFSGRIAGRYKRLYVTDQVHRYRLWRSLMGSSVSVHDLESPSIGNPYGYILDGVFVRSGSDYLHYYATIIGRLIRGQGRKTVVELGGGYGGMAYYLLRENPRLTYVDVDLPENLALTAFYLLSAFPDRNVALFGEIDLNNTDLGAFDVVLLPNSEVSRLDDDCADLAFNSYSLAEMSRETADHYISQFNRLARGFIFHVNHTRDSIVTAEEFEIDTNKFELVYRSPALWNLARNPDMDECEYLYKNRRCAYLPFGAGLTESGPAHGARGGS